METQQLTQDISTVFTEEIREITKISRNLYHGPNEFESIDEVLEYLSSEFPSKINQIQRLQQSTVELNFEKTHLYLIAILIYVKILKKLQYVNEETFLFALSTTYTPQKAELQDRLDKLYELQDLSKSYTINFPEDETIEILNLQTTSLTIREKLLNLFGKKPISPKESEDSTILRSFIFKKLSRRIQVQIDLTVLKTEYFQSSYDTKKSTILAHRQLCQLLEKTENRDKLFQSIQNTTIVEQIISIGTLSQKDYEYYIKIINNELVGSLTTENHSLLGALSLTLNTEGGLTEVQPSKNETEL